MKTPNTPAPEESLSLSFDEGSNNSAGDKISQRTKGNTAQLAPRFNQTPNSTKRVSNNSSSYKISRQPFKQITPKSQGNGMNCAKNQGNAMNKPTRVTTSLVYRKNDDKENTPLTSKDLPRVGTGKTTGLHGYKDARKQSIDHHQEKTSVQKSSNPRVRTEVSRVLTRKRYHSEDVLSFIPQQLGDSHRARANSLSSLAPSDVDNDISLDVSEVKCSPSPSNLDAPRDPPFYADPGAKETPKRHFHHDCNHKHFLENDQMRNQGNEIACQSSPKISDNVQQILPSQSNQRAQINEPRCFSAHCVEGCQPTDNTRQIKRNTAENDGQEAFNVESSQTCNHDTTQRRISDVRKRVDGVSKDFIRLPSNQSDSHSNQELCNVHNVVNQQDMFSKSDDMTNKLSDRNFPSAQPDQTKYDHATKTPSLHPGTGVQQSSDTCKNTAGDRPSATQRNSLPKRSSDINSENFTQQQAPNKCDDATHQVSTSPVFSRQLNADKNGLVIREQQSKEENLVSNKELKDQVKRQEEMIRVLQEQVCY